MHFFEFPVLLAATLTSLPVPGLGAFKNCPAICEAADVACDGQEGLMPTFDAFAR